MPERYQVGIVGARGHTGSRLIPLITGHPSLELAFAGSRELAGQQVPGAGGAHFEAIDPQQIADFDVEAVVLALPDGAGDPYVSSIDEDTVVIDISADHRFDDAWIYGLPELRRAELKGATRIANPGCYATAAQIALAPLVDVVDGVPAVFGVSGFSGAGSTPGPRNDVDHLADNLVPYTLVGHNHERETTRQLGIEVRFMPHVHPAFSGLLVTAHIPLGIAMAAEEVRARFNSRYGDEPLIEIKDEIPELKEGTGRPGILIGGFDTSADGRNAVVVAAEDNLLKGAAVQALQNLNLALGLPELEGIEANVPH